MTRPSKAQQETIERVMHEFKHGELETHGRKVRNPKQAIAIALHEAGAGSGKSRQAAGEGKDAWSRADLYAEARQRGIPGRSKMSKSELQRALHA